MRIAHFSDVHPLDLHGVSPLSFLNKRLAGGLNLLLHRRNKHPARLLDALCEDLNRSAPDHAVCTGDLSNLSFPSELRRARRALERSRLGPRGITLIPGNHDIYVWQARLARHFERALGAYAHGDDPSDRAGEYPFVRRRGPLAIVGANSILPSPPPLADGWLGAAQRAAIEQVLAALRGTCFRILLIHHPPVAYRMDLLRGLRDRGALQALLRRTGCELILHGHEHRDLRAELPGRDGPIPVIGAGSGTYDDPRRDRRARYNIYTIEEGRLLGIETRVHDPATDRFLPVGGEGA